MKFFWQTHLLGLTAAAIFLAVFFGGAVTGPVGIVAAVLILVGCWIAVCRRPDWREARRLPAVGLFAVGCAAVAIVGLRLGAVDAGSGLAAERVSQARAIVLTDPVLNARGQYEARLRLQVVRDKVGRLAEANWRVRALFAENRQALAFLAGDTVQLTGRLSRHQTIYVKSARRFLPVPPSAWWETIRHWRLSFRRNAETALIRLAPELCGLVAALVLGRQDQLDPVMNNAFYRSGCAHIVALSGMHLAVLAALCLKLLEPPVGRRWAFWPVLAICSMFVWLVGPFPSLLRALIMFTIYGLLRQVQASPSIAAVLAWTVPIAGLVAPEAIATPGFLLSCAALAGILVFATAVKTWLSRLLKPWLAEQVSTGLCAFVPTAPVLLVFRLPLQPQGIIAGIVLAPLSLLYLWVGLTYMLIGDLWPLAGQWLAGLLEMLYAVIRLCSIPFVF